MRDEDVPALLKFLAELHRSGQIPVLCKYIADAKARALEEVNSTNWSCKSGFALVAVWRNAEDMRMGIASVPF